MPEGWRIETRWLAVALMICAAWLTALSAERETLIVLRPAQPFFIRNAGQYPPEILYYTDIVGGRLWVRENDLVISLIELEPDGERSERFDRRFHGLDPDTLQCEQEPKPRRISNVYVTFPGADFSRITPDAPCATKINIFKGNDPAKWVTEIPTFGRVRIEGLAEGVDLVLGAASPGPLWRLEGVQNAIAAAPKPGFDTSAGVSRGEEAVRFDADFGSFALALWEASPDADRVVSVGGISGRLPNRLPAPQSDLSAVPRTAQAGAARLAGAGGRRGSPLRKSCRGWHDNIAAAAGHQSAIAPVHF